jgi:hypothetical protein
VFFLINIFIYLFILGFFTFNVEKEDWHFIENVGGVDENVLSIVFN